MRARLPDHAASSRCFRPTLIRRRPGPHHIRSNPDISSMEYRQFACDSSGENRDRAADEQRLATAWRRATYILHGGRRIEHEFARRNRSWPDRECRSSDVSRRAGFRDRAWRCRIHTTVNERRIDAPMSSGSSRARRTQDPIFRRPSTHQQHRNAPRPSNVARMNSPNEIGSADRRTRLGAVIALIGAFGTLHLAQQRVHFRHRQNALRANRSMASHGP